MHEERDSTREELNQWRSTNNLKVFVWIIQPCVCTEFDAAADAYRLKRMDENPPQWREA